MIPEKTKQALRRVVGEANCLDSEVDRFGYSYDASFVPLVPAHKPDIVVRPGTTEEVSRILALPLPRGSP